MTDLRQLAIQYINEYRQGNPFHIGENFTQFNIIYKKELAKFFKDKPQTYYTEYYNEVHRREKESDQLLMV